MSVCDLKRFHTLMMKDEWEWSDGKWHKKAFLDSFQFIRRRCRRRRQAAPRRRRQAAPQTSYPTIIKWLD